MAQSLCALRLPPPPSESENVSPEYEGHYVSEPFASATMLDQRQGEHRDEGGDIVAGPLGGASVSAERGSSTSESVGVPSSEGVIVAGSLGGASDPFKDEGRYTYPVWMKGAKLPYVGWEVEGIDVKLFCVPQFDSSVCLPALSPDMRRRYEFD